MLVVIQESPFANTDKFSDVYCRTCAALYLLVLTVLRKSGNILVHHADEWLMTQAS